MTKSNISEYKYPDWQFDTEKHTVLPGLADVLAILASPWQALYWLRKAEPFLHDQEPLLALRNGQIAEVRRAAEMYDGNQGGT